MIKRIIHRWRSSVTGRWVSKLFASENKRETVEETERRDA